MSEITESKKSAKKSIKTTPEDAIDTFAYEMLEATDSAANVDPNSLIFPTFDSRADSDTLKLDPSFAEDVKQNGILQPPLVTPVRDKATGKTGLLIIAGRQRVKAAIAAANAKTKVIPVHIKTMTLREAVIACGVENIKRKSLSFWDEASYMLMLRDEYNMKQTEIKTQLGVSDAKVSQALAVFDLDERVQKLVRKGQLEPGTNTKVRSLKAVKDVDFQYGIAIKAIEGAWTSDDIDEAIARLEAKEAAKAKAAKEREKVKKEASPKATGASDDEAETEADPFAPSTLKIIDDTQFAAILNSVNSKVEKMRAKDNVDPTKLAFELGRLEGLKQGAGLKALPKSLAPRDE